jgi:hypothetical protein
MVMIWSSLARNRSPSPVVFGFFGRIVSSDATTESRCAIQGTPENEIAGFRAISPRKPAIPKPPLAGNLTPNQWLGSFFTDD